MALSPNINNREFDKFVDDSGNTAVRVFGSFGSSSTRGSILDASDLIETYTYADFGTNNERITLIVYSAASVPPTSAHKTFAYTLVGNKYRLDTVTWSLV